MILTKETRDYVRDGTLLRSQYESYMVTGIWEQGKGKCITFMIMEVSDPNHKCWVGHRVYGQPLSNYYGCEIVNYGISKGD